MSLGYPDWGKRKFMDQKLQSHWSDLIRPLFKQGTDFRIKDFINHYELVVSWKLGSDPSRPSKRSPNIRIIVSEEAVEDYQEKSERQKKKDDERLVQFIKLNLASFDPNHDNPIGVRPPEVEWIIGTTVLNS
jgi:hypothetical protein